MRKFTLLFAALLVALGVSAQTLKKFDNGYFEFPSRVTEMIPVTSAEQLANLNGQDIVIKHCHDHNDALGEGSERYLTLNSAIVEGSSYHTTLMYDVCSGLSMFTLEMVKDTVDGIPVFVGYRLKTIHAKTVDAKGKTSNCYLSNSQTLTTTTNVESAAVLKFDFVTIGNDEETHVVMSEARKSSADKLYYYYATQNSGQSVMEQTSFTKEAYFDDDYDAKIKEFAAQNQEIALFNMYTITATEGVTTYVQNANFNLAVTGSGAPNTISGEGHEGWSDMYNFMLKNNVTISNSNYDANQNLITGNITFRFPVSGSAKQSPVRFQFYGHNQYYWVGSESGNTVATLTEDVSDPSQWYIYAGYEQANKEFVYKIKNASLNKYLACESIANGSVLTFTDDVSNALPLYFEQTSTGNFYFYTKNSSGTKFYVAGSGFNTDTKKIKLFTSRDQTSGLVKLSFNAADLEGGESEEGDGDDVNDGGDDVAGVVDDVADAYLASGLYTMGVDANIQRGYVCASGDYSEYPVLTGITLNGYTQNSATAMENGKTWFVLAIDQDSYVFYNMGNGKYLVNSTGTSSGVVNFGDTPYIWNLSKNGNYTNVRDPWHASYIYLSGGCGRAPANRPMAWDDNQNDGGAKYTFTNVENTAWNLEALKTQIMDALVQELPLTLTYNQGTGTLTSSCRGINQADKVQTLLETFAFTGYTGATLGEIGFAQDGLTATVTFPFAVQTPVTFGAFNNDSNLWFADDNGVHVVKNSLPTQSTDANYQWKLIPQLAGKELTFAIQNVGTGKYVLSNATVSDHTKGAVTLADAGTQFIPNDAGEQFQVNGQTLYLSLNSSSTADQWIGINTSTHGGTTHNITSVEFATAEDVEAAKAVIGTGLGYPKTTTTEYADLNALTEANSKKAVTGTLNAYYACTDVELPENGKAYKISAWWRHRTLPLTFVAETSVSGLYAPAYVPTENATDENVSVFVCRKLEDGTYAFVTDNGYYFGWQTDNANSNGTSTTYSDATHWKVEKAVTGSNTGDLKQTELLGKLLLRANGTAAGVKDWYAYMYSYSNTSKHFHNAGANALYYGDNAHTVYYTFEEVSANAFIEVGLATIQETDKLLIGSELTGKTISTFSAPYATDLPDGVTAYYAAEAEEAGELILKPVDGAAIPGKQGVVLIGNASSATMLPAIKTVATISGNVFAHSATGPVTMGANAYILANGGQGIGIYKATAGSTLKQGKAYLNFTGSSANSFVLNFSGVTTDIEGAPTVAPSQQVIYDLSGRRVNAVTKGGIYIVNGKKMIIK